MGGVSQMKHAAVTHMEREKATMSTHMPTTTAIREQGAAQYTTGAPIEVEQPAVTTQTHQEQVVAGQTHQNVVEIPTVQEVVTYQDIEEVQVRVMTQEVPQVVHEPVEHIVG